MLLFFDDYLEGALYRPHRTDHFTHRAPLTALLAFYPLFDLDHVTNQHQNAAGAHLDTETTTVALIPVDFWHFGHLFHILHAAIV